MSLHSIPTPFLSIREHSSLPIKSENRNLFFALNNGNLHTNPLSGTFSAAKQKKRRNVPLSDHAKSSSSSSSSRRESLEIEVKLLLPNSSAHRKLSSLLSPYLIESHVQENVFFDGANSELSSDGAALRIRFSDDDRRCVLSLKSKPAIAGGISRVEEREEEIDPTVGRLCIIEPERLPAIESSEIMNRVRDEYRIGSEDLELVCLGGFRNLRKVYEWKGLRVELDETEYEFGRRYEIECESDDAERVRDLLEEFLEKNGIDYSYSQTNKFAVFRSGKKLLP